MLNLSNRISKSYIFLVHGGGNYFCRIYAEIINQLCEDTDDCRHTRIIVLPVYGDGFDEPTDSKFPRWLKAVHNYIMYWKKQNKTFSIARATLKPYLTSKSLRKISFVRPYIWFAACCLDYPVFSFEYIKYLLQSKVTHKSNFKEIYIKD